MTKNSKIASIVIALLALVNVLFLPIYQIFGGLFPENAMNFFDVAEGIIDGYSVWEYDVFWFYAVLFVPNLFVMIGALTGKSGLVRGFSIVGTVLLAGVIALCVAGAYDVSLVLDVEHGCIAFGTWLGLLLYIAGIIVPKKEQPAAPQQPTYTPSPYGDPQQTYVPQPPAQKVCPGCGSAVTDDMAFCGSCGTSLRS